MPSWIPTRTFRTYPREAARGSSTSRSSTRRGALLWMAQMHCIDMNAWYSRVDKPERPDFVLFDLDPPDGGFALAIRVAHLIREELERLELELVRQDERRGRDPRGRPDRAPRRGTSETYAFAERVARGSRSGTRGS